MDVLNLTDGTAAASIRRTISNIREICSTVRSSANMKAEFLALQKVVLRASKSKEESKSTPKGLKLDCPTRWSTLYYMLERFKELFPCLQRFALVGGFDEAADKTWSFPTDEDMARVDKLLNALEPIEKFIRRLEGAKYITISEVPFLLRRCFTVLESMKDDEDVDITDLVGKLMASLESRLGHVLTTVNVSLVAAALDPRHGDLSQYVGSFVELGDQGDNQDGKVGQRVWVPDNELIDSVWCAVEDWAKEYNEMSEIKSADVDARFGAFNNIGVSSSALACAVKELRRSMEDKRTAKSNANQDPLIFWRDLLALRLDMHVLKYLVLCVLCIPSSSAEAERCFSKAGKVISKLRSSLKPELAEDLVLLAKWSNNPFYDEEVLFDMFAHKLSGEHIEIVDSGSDSDE